jgi:hypothetical protein
VQNARLDSFSQRQKKLRVADRAKPVAPRKPVTNGRFGISKKSSNWKKLAAMSQADFDAALAQARGATNALPQANAMVRRLAS